MSRIVIVGAGMAGCRLAEEIRRRDSQGAYRITLIGSEPHAPYNRILLSSVVAGRHTEQDIALKAPSWFTDNDIELLRDATVARIDRKTRVVELMDGKAVGYDHLVLAMGAAPVLPPVRGIIEERGQMHPAVTAFRQLDDATRLSTLAKGASSAVVVGGGLLGLEAARGLIACGLQVDIVHGGSHLLDHHLDKVSGTALRKLAQHLGIGVHTGMRVTALEREGSKISRVRLADGYRLPADIVVIAAGVRPATRLAREAGIAVRSGVVVDDHLTSVEDPRIHALGDCAEHRGVLTRQVHPAWEQAEVLAERLVEGRSHYAGSLPAVRLRAEGLDVAAIGEVTHEDTTQVEVANPFRKTYKRLVLREGELVGGVFVGDVDAAGSLTVALERRHLVVDRTELLFGSHRTTISPADLPDDCTVCACNGVSAGAIRAVALGDDGGLAAVAETTRATTGCGGCRDTVLAVLAGCA